MDAVAMDKNDSPDGVDQLEALRNDTRATVSVPEAAKILGVSRSHLYNMINHGHIPALRLAKRRRITREWLLQQLRDAAAS
jgi:excisionase family DNA binding protein